MKMNKEYKLKLNANTEHQNAQAWYAGYGARIDTDDGGISHEAVDFDWFDDGATNSEVAEKLMENYNNLTADERDELVQLARGIREAAETVVGLLEDAVTAYDAGDLEAVIAALDLASCEETDHGDNPATRYLSGKLLEAVTVEPVSS